MAVKRGKMTYAELANNIGKVAPMARVAGMGMEDMDGNGLPGTSRGILRSVGHGLAGHPGPARQRPPPSLRFHTPSRLSRLVTYFAFDPAGMTLQRRAQESASLPCWLTGRR